MKKPEYKVPSMHDIESAEKNGKIVVSTFSGTGGSCLGYSMAGFDVVWASEFVTAAQECYALNHPETILDTRDIRDVTGAEILKSIGREKGDVDILDGSPPCAAFSSAGTGSKTWGDVKTYSDVEQRVDDLFFEYARIVDEIQPRVFVAENVAGLVRGKSKGYFLQILAALKACGYRVSVQKLNAKWLGVPQARERLIFIGVREDLQKNPVHPSPLSYSYTMRDVFPYMQAVRHEQGGFNTVAAIDRASPTITASQCRMIVEKSDDLDQFKERRLTIAELKKVCAYPDDFQLVGSYAQQWERLGRSVPPVMMQHVAQKIYETILSDDE